MLKSSDGVVCLLCEAVSGNYSGWHRMESSSIYAIYAIYARTP